MRKLIGILMALCILTVFVSSVSACVPGPDNNYCRDTFIPKPYVGVPHSYPAPQNIAFAGSTTGTAVSEFGCTNDAQVGTTAGANSASSGFSVTDSYAAGTGYNYAGAAGGSGFQSV